DGTRTEFAIVGRNIAPAEHEQALVDDDLFEHRLDPIANRRIAGEENEAGAITALRRQRHAELRRFLTQEAVGHLDQDSRAISGIDFATARATVQKIDEKTERLDDH